MISFTAGGTTVTLPSPESGNGVRIVSDGRVYETLNREINFKQFTNSHTIFTFFFEAVRVPVVRELLNLLAENNGKVISVTALTPDFEFLTTGVITNDPIEMTSASVYCKIEGAEREHYSFAIELEAVE